MGAHTEKTSGGQNASKKTQDNQVKEHQPVSPARRARTASRGKEQLSQIPKEELTPNVKSIMTQLMDEVDRLKSELNEANERVNVLENIADEDPLVPVLNRRGFMRELERTLAYMTRYQTAVSLLYIDMDGFKGINDTYGHAAGDAALKHVAQLLLNFVRRSDIVARLGGDEFAILLQQADKENAEIKACKLAELITKHPCLYENLEIPLKLTVGVAEMQANDSPEDLMNRADQEMYAIRARVRKA